MKINKFNGLAILIIAAVSSLLLVLINLTFPLTNSLVLFVIIFIISAISLWVYELINSNRLKKTIGDFLSQVKLTSTQKNNKKLIKKYGFNDIQTELHQIVGQIQADYNEQKRYIENVSHELMTPISIIRGKLELLIQSPNIEKSDFGLINDILLKLDRLTRVNQSLVLLSKIDYNQYASQSKVSINDVIDETLNLFEDQIRLDKLSIRKNIENDLFVNMNENLAYLLIKNIIKNAVIHNVQNGQIIITQTNNNILFENTGDLLHSTTDKLFERFIVAIESDDSIGLGLSIIKRICEVSNIKISYTHNNGIHKVNLNFNFLQN